MALSSASSAICPTFAQPSELVQQRRERPRSVQKVGSRDADFTATYTGGLKRRCQLQLLPSNKRLPAPEAESKGLNCRAAATNGASMTRDYGVRLSDIQARNVQIEGLGSYKPTKTVTIEDTIQMAIENSPNVDPKRLTRLLKKLFKNLGSVSRQWSEDPATSRPVDWLQEAFQQALENADWVPADIDVIIHTGICRGVHEPSAAAVYSNVLGTRHAQAFDVVDACNSWILGAQLADSMIKTGFCKRVALVSTVSANNPYLEGGYKIGSWEQIGYKVAGLTVGSAASVTLIGGGHHEDWGLKVSRIHNSDHVALCMINEPSTMRHLGLDSMVPQEIQDDYFAETCTLAPQFYSQGTDLFALQLGWFRDVMSKALVGAGRADVGNKVLTHSAFETHYTEILTELGLQDRHFNIHAHNGNIADNTAPVALKQAIEDGYIKAYDRVSYIGQASGASTALATFAAPAALVEMLGPQLEGEGMSPGLSDTRIAIEI